MSRYRAHPASSKGKTLKKTKTVKKLQGELDETQICSVHAEPADDSNDGPQCLCAGTIYYFQVSSGATQGRMNGHTEMAGGITLARTSGSLDQDDVTMILTERWLSITASRSRMPLTLTLTMTAPLTTTLW